jgi:hypothetical protein
VAKLRRANIDASAGAVDEIARVTARIRAALRGLADRASSGDGFSACWRKMAEDADHP